MKRIILLSIVVFSLNATSHPGRTDSAGCHTNRKTGEYHCHGKTGSSSSGNKTRKKVTTTKSKSSSRKRATKTTKSTDSGIKGTGAAVGELYFKDCDEAKKKGYWNIRKGQPGYRKGLDPDGNGVACERK
ncbi:MAG: excalibur calcium-binding domain-containing protein [Leptotrichiaceae bacterium]|nr:excalibur calcium-binding domain-containing protein [Leptotrichiaceae bacterium]